jgi:hypothetical protein
MELTYDWRSFQSVFYPQKRTMNIHLETQDSGVIFAVVENGTVIAAYDEKWFRSTAKLWTDGFKPQ